MATKMANDENNENGRYGHKDDTTLVSFWLKKETLEKWDKFCKEKGKRRTDLIKDAVTDYMLKREVESDASGKLAVAKAEQQELKDKIDLVLKQLGNTKRDEVKASDPNLQGLILEFLEEKPLTDAKLARLMVKDRGLIQDTLAVMKADGFVKVRYTKDHEGEWYLPPKAQGVE